MSSVIGRIGLLGTGGLFGSAMWDKGEGASELWKAFTAMLPKSGEGGHVAHAADSRVDQLAQDVRAMMIASRHGSSSMLVVSPGGGSSGKVSCMSVM